VAALATLLLWLRPSTRLGPADFASRSPAPTELNVVVVTLDTLRADRLGCYGFRGVDTPHIDALAAEAVVFEQSTATVPLTFPSHSSIFTGLVPPRHGVRDNGGFFLEDEHTTMAERFEEAGYATGAFIGAWVLDSRWGLDQGFDRYADQFDLSEYKVLSLGTVQKPGDEVMDGALEWLDSVKDERFFAWVHLYDPHTPYEPPEPFASHYPGHAYLGEVAYTDQVVGRLLEWLRTAGVWERTVLVLTADHGESLGEHGESTHAFFIYDSAVAVPLIVRTPWGDTGRSRVQTSGVDIMPTVLELAGLAPEPGIDGRSLAPFVLDPSLREARVAYAESYFPRYHYGWQHLRAVRDGRHKLIDAPEPELYDTETDPGESRNLYETLGPTAERLRLRLEELAGSEASAAPEQELMDPETLQRLAALGYVGNTVDVDPDAVLPDPKSKIGLFGLMSEAKAAGQDGRTGEAITKMKRVIEEDPGIVDAHLTLANWRRREGDVDGAIASYQEVLNLQTGNVLALTNLANLYRELGRHEAALEGYRGVLEVDPRNPQTWFHLATLQLDLARVDAAEETFRQALEHNPDMGASYNSLGAIAWSRGDLDEAERLVRRGLELEPEVRKGRFNLARLLEARGDLGEAERLYREELAVYADAGKAHFNLAQLLRERGDRDAYLAQLRLGVEQAPDFGACYFFLAREELGAGRLEEAADLATRGLKVDNVSDVAPLGYYVLADVYNRQGRSAESAEAVEKARRLEETIRAHPLPRL
jgi:arylsulfatase A-like enzyme/Tfp pilus assembly protein PilF